MTTDNFCFYLQNRLIQTSQTGGQWYSDTSPFSIPCIREQITLHSSNRVSGWQLSKGKQNINFEEIIKGNSNVDNFLQ
jgi:hypothetical protein